MNSGILASRYAKALLKYVRETGNGDKVYAQARMLVSCMERFQRFREYVESQEEPGFDEKIRLMEAAVDEPLAQELTSFLRLVMTKRRCAFFMRMLNSFVEQYRDAVNMKVGKLVTAMHVDGMKERLEALFCERIGADVRLEATVDPDIIGGFVFEVDDLRMDASVKGQMEKTREKLLDRNNRIV